MSKAIDKLRSTSGETISEVLVGVLIVGLATVLFVAMVSAATSISNAGVQGATDAYAEMSAVDERNEVSDVDKVVKGTGKVTIKLGNESVELSVDTYTATDGDLTSYQLITSEGN